METRQRNFALDILRGVAILLVLIRHVPGEPTSSALRVLFELGWSGVDLFFVLSGFLISTLLYQEIDRTGTIGLKRFWLRRGFKIWPSYYICFTLMVIIASVVNLSSGNNLGALKHILSSLPNLIFIQNYTGYMWPHSWSLAVEEHFYFLLPLLLLLLARRGAMRKVPLLMLFICAAVLVLRTGLFVAGRTRWQSFYYPTHMRIDSLSWGVLLGYMYRYHRESFNAVARLWPLLLLVSLPLLMVTVLFPLRASGVATTVGFTLIYLAYGSLVIIAGAYPDMGKRFRPVGCVAQIGVYSYSIYLAHSALSLIPAFTPETPEETSWTVRMAFWGLSIGTGILLSHLVERPFLRFRQRVLPPGTSPATPLKRVTQPRAAVV